MKYRTLILGVLSPVFAAGLGSTVYTTLTRASEDRDADFMFRLTMTAAAMAIPFLLTLISSWLDRKSSRGFTTPSKIGFAIALLSLGLAYVPINGALSRSKQIANQALDDVPAPEIETTDLNGQTHRLSDYRGKVVLLNIWATWCAPCRREMPELDQLFKDKGSDGLVVLGLSTEETELQRKFAKQISVTYPLLTAEGNIPDMFSNTARFPSNFLIDRQGRLHPAPSTDQPFENLISAVDELLRKPAP